MAQVPGRNHPKVGQDQVLAYITPGFGVYHGAPQRKHRALYSQGLDMTQ